jgi:hypothetical protein
VVGAVVEGSAQFGQDDALGGGEVDGSVDGVADAGDAAVRRGLTVVSEGALAEPDDVTWV